MTGNNSSLIQQFISKLNTVFLLKNLRELYYFLGIETIRTKEYIHLIQKKYIMQLLNKVKLHESKAETTPMIVGKILSKHDSVYLQNATHYSVIV